MQLISQFIVFAELMITVIMRITRICRSTSCNTAFLSLLSSLFHHPMISKTNIYFKCRVSLYLFLCLPSHSPRSWANLENGHIRVVLNLALKVALIPTICKSWNQMEVCSWLFASPFPDLWHNSKDGGTLLRRIQCTAQQPLSSEPRAQLHPCSLAMLYSIGINFEIELLPFIWLEY